MSEDKVEIVEVKPKRKKKSEIEVGLIEETNPDAPEIVSMEALPAIFKQKIERDPLQLIEWEEPVEPLQEELSLEPVVELVEEKEIAPEPSVEASERREGSAGQGSWHGKHNLARQSKSPGAKKYMPVHRQR